MARTKSARYQGPLTLEQVRDLAESKRLTDAWAHHRGVSVRPFSDDEHGVAPTCRECSSEGR